MEGLKFPIMLKLGMEREEAKRVGLPDWVPFDFIAEHAHQCEVNHGQTPMRLAERGGLSPREVVAIVRGKTWREVEDPHHGYINELLKLLKAWDEKRANPPPVLVRAGKRWEYYTVEATDYSRENGNGSIPFDELDAIGDQGWELVCCTPAWGNTSPTLIFKREIKE